MQPSDHNKARLPLKPPASSFEFMPPLLRTSQSTPKERKFRKNSAPAEQKGKEERKIEKKKPNTKLAAIRATMKSDLERPAMINMTAKACDQDS